MIKDTARMINELGKPRDVLLFAVAGFAGLCMPFLFHIAAGFVLLPVPKEQWGTQAEDNIVRTIFIFAGFLAALVPAVVSGLYSRHRTRSAFKRTVFYAGLACGALLTMLWLSPGGWCFITK